MPRGPHDGLPSGSKYSTALVPGGAIGYTFQSYSWPCMEWYTDLDGCFLDVRTRFRVMHAWVVSVFHSWMGQSWSVEATDEVVLEGLDHSFCCVHAMIVWLHKLPLAFFLCEEFLRGLVA